MATNWLPRCKQRLRFVLYTKKMQSSLYNVYTSIPYFTTKKKQQQNVQPTLNFFIWCKKTRKTYSDTIYLPFNFLQLFFAFAVKANSMGLLTEFFMIHNFSFSRWLKILSVHLWWHIHWISFYFTFLLFGRTIYNFVIALYVYACNL